MRRAAIVSPIRTPIGNFGGALREVTADVLATHVIREVVTRAAIDPTAIDEVIVSQSYASSEAPCLGRYAALAAGLPIETAGHTVERRCGSGLQAIASAAMMVQSGAADVVLVAGVESMSNIEFYTTAPRWGARTGSITLHDRLQRGRERSEPIERFGAITSMPQTAENLAKDFGITRHAADAYAVMSHQRAAEAAQAGRFAREIVPIPLPAKKGPPKILELDESIRADASINTLAGLRPIVQGGIVTPGNAAQQSDAAAACLVVGEERLESLGLTPLAFFHSWASAGCDPSRMGIGPVPAVTKLLTRTGLDLKQMDLIEVNEAFAAQVLAVLSVWDWSDLDRVNVNGSAISLGHPIGATGVRMMTTLLYELDRRGGRYGLEALAIGGGQGIAAVFERA